MEVELEVEAAPEAEAEPEVEAETESESVPQSEQLPETELPQESDTTLATGSYNRIETGGSFGCTISVDGGFDPTMPVVLSFLMALLGLRRRRYNARFDRPGFDKA